MSGKYFYTGILGFALGVGIASVLVVGFAYVVWVILMSGVFALVARRARFSFSSGHLFFVSLFLISVALGFIRFNIAATDISHTVFDGKIGSEILLQGVVVREPDRRENTTHIYVQIDDELLLVKTNRYTEVSYGDLISITGILEKPESFETDLGRTFNYPKYLQARGVSYTISLARIEIEKSKQGNIVMQYILDAKKTFMQRIEYVLPEPEVGLAEGLLLGVKQALGDELETVFRRTGIIHIVVLSGYNITIVVLFITYILSYIVPFRFRLPFGVVSIVAFALLVGLSATVVRASIMALLVLLARHMGRTYAVTRGLLFAGLVMILINPYLLVYDVGFQLSFLATLGLLFFAPWIEKKVYFMPTWFGAREFLTATISTQIFVMPILLYSIGEFSVVAVVVNLLVLPMVPLAMLLTFLTGISGMVSTTLSVAIGFTSYLTLSYILTVATFFASVPFASFVVPTFPFWIVLVSYGFMSVVLYVYIVPKLGRDTYVEKEVLVKSEITDEYEEIQEWTLEEEDVVRKRLKQKSGK